MTTLIIPDEIHTFFSHRTKHLQYGIRSLLTLLLPSLSHHRDKPREHLVHRIIAIAVLNPQGQCIEGLVLPRVIVVGNKAICEDVEKDGVFNTSRIPAGQRRVIGGEFFSRGPSGEEASSYGEQGDAHAVSTVTLNKEYDFMNMRTVYSTIPFPSFLDNTLILQQYLFPLCYNKHFIM